MRALPVSTGPARRRIHPPRSVVIATRTVARESADHAFSIRALMGASAVSAILLSAKAVTDALSPGIRWAGATVAPAVLAVLLVGLVIVLHVIRADRS
jgi:hypothetical protein